MRDLLGLSDDDDDDFKFSKSPAKPKPAGGKKGIMK